MLPSRTPYEKVDVETTTVVRPSAEVVLYHLWRGATAAMAARQSPVLQTVLPVRLRRSALGIED